MYLWYVEFFISLFVCDFLIINLPDAFFLDPLPLPLDDPEGSSGWIGSLSLPFRLSRLCLLCLLLRPPALTDRGRVINVMIMRKVHNTNKRYCLHCCKHFIFDFWCYLLRINFALCAMGYTFHVLQVFWFSNNITF